MPNGMRIAMLCWIAVTAGAAEGQPPLLAPPIVGRPAAELQIDAEPHPEQFDPRATMPPAEASQLTELMQYLIHQNVPERYTDDSDWDQTQRIYAGVKLRTDGWKLRTKRRWRELNHGAWRRIELRRRDPEKSLQVRVSDIEQVGSHVWRMRLQLESPISVVAHWQQWNLGVRLWRVTVTADALVQLDLTFTVGLELDLQHLPPDLVLDPVVESADFRISQFNVHRVGHLRGDVGEELGRLGYQVVEKRVIEPARADFADRLNRQIDRKREDLRLSPSKWIEQWLQPPTAANEAVE